VAVEGDDVTRIAADIESLGLDVEVQQFVKDSHVQPFDHFGSDVTED